VDTSNNPPVHSELLEKTSPDNGTTVGTVKIAVYQHSWDSANNPKVTNGKAYFLVGADGHNIVGASYIERGDVTVLN